MDRHQLAESLIIWIQTFNVDTPCDSVESLTDGVIMAQVLAQIAPGYFDESWIAKIKTDAANNWRLKVSNLKKVLKGILDYYSEVLVQQIHDFQMPDVNAIGEHADLAELGRLLQLILGCAVNCEDKQEYIKRIMGMEETVQHMVMTAIQELMQKESPLTPGAEGISEISEQLKKTLEELNNVMEAKEEMAQRCHELDLQVAALQEERIALAAENESLNERINQSDNLEDPSTPAGRRLNQLQSTMESLQEELFKLESSRDDLAIKLELQEKDMADLQQKNEELQTLADEARQLKDEMDILRHSSDKAAKYEATIETYKKKLDELGDLKRQLKLLEDKNMSYMQTNMELEEESRKSQLMKSQLDMYKRQVQELQIKMSEETKRADKAEFENTRQQEKMGTLQREKERLVAEKDSMKEMIDELKCTQSLPGGSSSGLEGDLLSDSSGLLEMMTLPTEIKEKIMRLEHENKMLKIQRSANEDEQGQLLQTMLDDANSRKNELETENRLANQRILALEAQLEDMQESARRHGNSEDNSELMKKLNEQIQRTKTFESDIQKKITFIEDLESRLTLATDRLNKQQDELNRKDDEMSAMEERYRRYLEKAKSVIKSMDPKHANSAQEMQALRAQLQEKDRLIDHLQRDHEKSKLIKEQEEKLIVSAMYNLSMQLHRKSVDERLNNCSVGQSFLARQRLAHTRRAQSLNATHQPGSR